MALEIKICGLSTPETLDAALGAGADMVGMVFFPPSPRHVDPATAGALAARAHGRAQVVALTVDADDAALTEIIAAIRPSLLQLHGKETPQRVAEIRARFGLPVMKAIGIATRADLADLPAYEEVADLLLLDAKPPKDAVLPGGNGRAFDWDILAGLQLARPLVLSGGLDPSNVAEAVRRVRPAGIDVSSGVESAPGIKDVARITAFIRAAREADRADAPLRPEIETSHAQNSHAKETSLS